MKLYQAALTLIVFLGLFSNTYSQGISEDLPPDQNSVEVYYFHNQRRCVTCREVEKVSKATVAELYNGMVKFEVYNLEEAKGKDMAKKLKVAGQALVIIKGETKIDLTNESFRYAKNEPERLEALIKKTIDPLLK